MFDFVARSTFKQQPNICVVSSIELDTSNRVHARGAGTLRVSYISRMSAEKNPIGFIDLRTAYDALPGQFSLFGGQPR